MGTKERIASGAQELFFRFGIRRITMDEIANHLGISKKTIYRSFKDKEELVLYLFKSKLKDDKRDFTCIQQDSKNIVDEVFCIMSRMSELFSKINPVIFYDLQKYHPKIWQLFKDFKGEFILGIVEKMITKGIKDKLVRSDVNPKVFARLRMEEIEMGFNPDVFPIDKFKLIEVQLALAEHFLYGICTLKAYKMIESYKKNMI